ncbi:flagellar hook capping FlgD N-terminal domain-containing protein [Nocardioides sp. YIM 152315]|uniref:flagellar hook assembly protein FlgD n=1 Tax=Nocardioides sp. YIM 152315 TaxID=3031760 RepID=UPI0023DA4127|nr:flagellar hook capping FlgD N-terminal domain-containing protein [Nocardioides sp. YIM 152315]MDF1605969.1 flagellar hook capping FlgD N-terminal domain-containing protein [Nocardioides sp. YIM 152315]
MSIPATEAVTPTGMYQSPTAATGSSSDDKEMFLNLMVAQLRYQDPLNPTDSGQFLAQNAQFTALEKMQDVADQTAALLSAQVSFGAAGMVGKNVTYLTEDGDTASGVVGSVTYDASGPLLQIGDQSVTLGQISSISAAAEPAPAPSTSTATAG